MATAEFGCIRESIAMLETTRSQGVIISSGSDEEKSELKVGCSLALRDPEAVVDMMLAYNLLL